MNRHRINSVVSGVVGTVFIWVAVLMVRSIGGATAPMFNFALLIGFLATVGLWLSWAVMAFQQSGAEQWHEKAKRSPAEDDARLSRMLLQMLDEDERRTLKHRLRDDLRADGQAISLDELVARGEQAGRDS